MTGNKRFSLNGENNHKLKMIGTDKAEFFGHRRTVFFSFFQFSILLVIIVLEKPMVTKDLDNAFKLCCIFFTNEYCTLIDFGWLPQALLNYKL